MKKYKPSSVTTSFIGATEVFCSNCGDSCMHDGVNHIGMSIDISGLPQSVKDKVGFVEANLCYPCWLGSMVSKNV